MHEREKDEKNISDNDASQSRRLVNEVTSFEKLIEETQNKNKL